MTDESTEQAPAPTEGQAFTTIDEVKPAEIRRDEQSVAAEKAMKEAAERPDSEAPLTDPTTASGNEQEAAAAEASLDAALGSETQVEGEQA